MDKPAVSVIIPISDNNEFLGNSIESVLNQSFQDFEILIINHSKTRNAQNIVNSYNNKNIHYYYKENSNLNSARNYGLKFAKGDYIALLESGDTWDAEKLERQVNILDKNPKTGLVYCGTSLMDNNSKVIKHTSGSFPKGFVFSRLVKHNFLQNGSVALFRRDCLEKVGLFDESVKIMTEWEFYLRFSLKYKFHGIDKHLVKHRIDDKSKTNDFEFFENSGFKVLNKVFQAKDISSKHLRLINHAYAMRYSDVGKKYFERNCFDRSKGYFLEALKRDFSVCFRSDVLFFYLLSYFSYKNIRFFNKFIKDLNKLPN